MPNQREFLNALADMPPQHRAWLELDPSVSDDAFPLFCFYGFGIVVNTAQEEAAKDIFRRYPPGTQHVQRWANRTGKTTGDMLDHLIAIWRKWRFYAEEFDDWWAYPYQTLHSAPLNRLMGKAWGAVERMIAGTDESQMSPLTNRVRPGILRSFFEAGKSRAPDGSDELWVRCVNNAKIDFLSTQGGAGRMESDKWWLLTWDEFVRQQPVSDIPLLIDQTFLPRSSDHMAPVVYSGTATEDAEPIYAEIEEMAEQSPKDWNFSTYDRRVNFAQTRESIERQLRVSFDKEAAGRSVEGLSGQSGFGLFPQFAIDNCFTESLPERTAKIELPGEGVAYRFFGALDHSAGGDEIVMSTWACPYPYDRDRLLNTPVLGVEEQVMKSSRTIQLSEIVEWAKADWLYWQHSAIIVDTTGEAGIFVHRAMRAAGLPVYPCNYAAKISPSMPPNKHVAVGYLQRMMALGIPLEHDQESGLVAAWPKFEGKFGALRLPASWRRTKRQLATFKMLDAHLEQDRAMTQGQLAWHVWRLYDGAQRPKPQRFNVMARRRRAPVAIGGIRR